jgi:hypothetical protein
VGSKKKSIYENCGTIFTSLSATLCPIVFSVQILLECGIFLTVIVAEKEVVEEVEATTLLRTDIMPKKKRYFLSASGECFCLSSFIS